MNKVVLEIGTEEIPSVYMSDTLSKLKRNSIKYLEKSRIKFEKIHVYGTPRRLVLFIEGIEDKQTNIMKKVKGPSTSIAFDKQGIPTMAAHKFAQSNQVNIKDLLIEETKKGEYVFAQRQINGEETFALLPAMFFHLINGLGFPKSMHWGRGSFRFIRPIRWILALYNEQIVHFKLEDLHSDRLTYGHRLLCPDSIQINSANEYFAKIKDSDVVIDPVERENIIIEQINSLVEEKNGKEWVNENLLQEVIYLVENPKVLLGEFDHDYLKLPSEVLKSVMIKHQKYFPVYGEGNQLLPYFIVVINGNDEQFFEIIRKGNEKVLKARLEDACFFYQEDQKTNNPDVKPLEKQLEKLKNVIYQKDIGSMYQKVIRLIALGSRIGEILGLDQTSLSTLQKAARLCKSDLTTEMVTEFPELQGIMGREYANLQGEEKRIGTTIFEHYLPRFSNDVLPETLNGSILSIADKIDNITACFFNNMIPDGSQDPYALRRQALGILNIILEKKMNLPLEKLIEFDLEQLVKDSDKEIIRKNKLSEISLNIVEFILQRYRNLLREKGFHYDIVEAVLMKHPSDVVDALSRIRILENIYHQPKFIRIITSAIRAYNLSKKITEYQIDSALLQEEEEKTLFQAYQKINPKVKKAISSHQYKDVFDDLDAMSDYIDQFFDNVLVMDKNEKIKKNRLSLLKAITKMYHSIADLSQIALAKGKSK